MWKGLSGPRSGVVACRKLSPSRLRPPAVEVFRVCVVALVFLFVSSCPYDDFVLLPSYRCWPRIDWYEAMTYSFQRCTVVAMLLTADQDLSQTANQSATSTAVALVAYFEREPLGSVLTSRTAYLSPVKKSRKDRLTLVRTL